jgi:hypothetical protein
VFPLGEPRPRPATACRAGRAGARVREELRRGGSARTYTRAVRPRVEGHGGGLARAAAEGTAPVRADHGPRGGGGGGCGTARVRRMARLVSAGHARAGWGPSGAGAERERCTGAAARRGGPAGGCAGMPAVLLQRTRVSRGGSARE